MFKFSRQSLCKSFNLIIVSALRLKNPNLITRFAALFLCFWISGAACAIPCIASEIRAELAKASDFAVTSEETACPISGGDCCHGKTAESELDLSSFALPQKNAPQFDCCVFANFLIQPGQKIGQMDAPIFLSAIAKVKFSFPAIKQHQHLSAETYQTTPRTRGSTHLSNCVFLI